MKRLTYFQVTRPGDKPHIIAWTAHAHFNRKAPLLILVPNDGAQAFIDSLLWRYPKSGFLPHCTTTTTTSSPIAITTFKMNFNNATSVFNLCPEPVDPKFEGLHIYEFEDLSTEDVKLNFKQRYAHYLAREFHIEEGKI